jgi:hypothetical protein
MTETEIALLCVLAHKMIDATPEQIAAKCSPEKYIEFCQSVQKKLLHSEIQGRLRMITALGIKINQALNPKEKTDAEILTMVREVFPNASIIQPAHEKARATVKREENPATPRATPPAHPDLFRKPSEPTVAEVERDFKEAAELNKLATDWNHFNPKPPEPEDDDDKPW